MRGTRAEDALLRSGGVPSRVHAQNISTSAIEPSENDDLIAGSEASQSLKHLRVEDEPGLGCAFVALQGADSRSVGDETLPMTFNSKLATVLSR